MINLLLTVLLLFTPNEVKLEISGIKKPIGNLRIAAYNTPENYLDESQMAHSYVVRVTETGTMTFTIDLPAGEYALAVFHDVNEDGKLNKNLIGIPTEHYGFSNNTRGAFGPPSYDQAKIPLIHGDTLRIELQ
ncbi:MAG: DUF2141 domain-containing protein [Marinoscillum sp.]|uniref:DUF2141 domain-containing protein n=1 Tax=Marinoscillum sp. TaxID=2024838 RepID=UPI0032FBC3DF